MPKERPLPSLTAEDRFLLCRRLCLQCIDNELDYLTHPVSVDGKPAYMVQTSAERWLLRGGADFHDICDIAGVHPGAIRAEAGRPLKRMH